jgi:hypothetical protein
VRRHHLDRPALITTAPENNDDDYDRRRKRYAIMMGTRALCVLVAALTYRTSLWLALGLVLAGAIIPWCAVIIANDRPPKRRTAPPRRGTGAPERALPPGRDNRTVDG